MLRSLPLMMILLAPLVAGCASERRQLRQENRAHRQDTRSLQESAELYWRALRWSDLGVCAEFIEDRSRRIEWMTAQSAGNGWRYRSTQLVMSEAGPSLLDDEGEPLDPDDRALRRGQVMVQVQRYASDGVIDQRLLMQDWYRTEAGWFVKDGHEVGVEPATGE